MPKPLKVRSREYKLLLDPAAFTDALAIAAFWADLRHAAATPSSRTGGRFDELKTRTIVFFDTPDHALRGAGLVLRRRVESATGEVQLTLKCRSPDRYIAAGLDLDVDPVHKSERKLEEDIGHPFACQFSQSQTIKAVAKHDAAPARLADAARLYPVLSTLALAGDTELAAVNGLTMFERVHTGASLILAGADAPTEASVALILWSDADGARPLVAELSFRLEDEDENFTRALASSARTAFALLQPFASPTSITKTAYVYADRGDD